MHEEAEIKAESDLHISLLQAIIAHGADAAEATSHHPNYYLVEFARASLGGAAT